MSAGKHIFDSGIDLKQAELFNARMQNLFIFPDNPVPGQVLYRSDLGLGYFWDGVEEGWRFFGKAPNEEPYTTEAELFDDQENQAPYYQYLVEGEEKIYIYLGTTTGDETDYFIIEGGGITDAPIDGTANYRKDGGWVAFTPFSGAYADLTGKPTLFSGDYNDLSNKPTLFSGSYNDLTDKPTLFSGDYNDLSNKPTLFTVAGTPAEGQVVTWVSGAPTWQTPSGGGGSLWTDQTTYISRDGKVVIGKATQFSSAIQTLEIKFRRASGSFNSPEIQIFDFEDNVLLNWGNNNPNYPVWSRAGFTIGSATGGGAYTFFHRSGLGSAFAGDAFIFQNGDGTEIFASNNAGVLRLGNPALSIGTTVGLSNGLRHRSGVNGSAGTQFLVEDSLAVSNFQVDNIGRTIARGTFRSNGMGVNMAPLGNGIQIKGANDGLDAFRLYTQTDVLVTYYRRTLGWIFKGFGLTGPVISIQDSASTLKIRMDASGRMFLYGIPSTTPTAGTFEVYVDTGFLKLAV